MKVLVFDCRKVPEINCRKMSKSTCFLHGAFHNKPETVAEHFKQVLLEENYGQYFDKVCFAIYGSENGKNITAFRKCFENVT